MFKTSNVRLIFAGVLTFITGWQYFQKSLDYICETEKCAKVPAMPKINLPKIKTPKVVKEKVATKKKAVSAKKKISTVKRKTSSKK